MTRDLTWITAFALVCVGVLFLMPTPRTSPGAIVIDDVLLFDGERFRERRQVLIEDGRIVEVGAAVRAPTGAQRIDGSGKTLLPGLIDAHTHTWGDALRDALRFGITTQIDMFTDTRFFAGERERRDSTESTDRADLFSAGTLVTADGGHGTQFGLSIPTLDDAADADAFVAARQKEGSDFIKLVIEDGSAYGFELPTLDAERVQAVVRAAHERDLLAVAHVSTLSGAKMAVDAGIDGLVHIFHDAVIDDALLAELAGRDFFVIPTLAVIAGFDDGTDEAPASGAAKPATTRPIVGDDPRLSAAQKASLETSFPGQHKGALERAMTSVRRLHESGITILAGTDAPNPGTAHGVSMHAELLLLERAGLDTSEVLAAATSLPATHFPLGARGRVQPEMRADLLLIDGDPRQDMTATARIDTVFKNGRAIDFDAATSRPAAAAIAPTTISDFEDGTVATSLGFGWQATTDEMAGGKSSVTFETASESDNGFVRVSATVAAGFPYPWSGLIYFPGERPMMPVDATGIDAVRFRVRGDAGSYRLMFFVEGQTMPVMRGFEVGDDWSEVSIGLDAVSEPERLTAIAWCAGPTHGEYRFDLDDVRLEREPLSFVPRILLAIHRRLLPDDSEIGWTPYLWLVYLTFMFLGWFFRPEVPRFEIVVTIAGVVCFLPLYFRGFWTSGHRSWSSIVGIAALGVVVGPINWGASSFFIYAAAFIGRIRPTRTALVALLGLHAVVIVETLLLGLPWVFWVFPLLFGTIVGLVNLYDAQQARRRVELRLDHDEVRRLAATAERERIGRDLHDLLGHTLSLITIKSALAQRLLDRDLDRSRRELEDIEEVSRKAMEEVRDAVTGYRAVDLASELAHARLALEANDIRFDYRYDSRSLPADVDHTLALVLREAVTNVARHARASLCRVRFERDDKEGRLRVVDDGRAAELTEGHGLQGMRERLDRLGGSLEIRTGTQTVLEARVPLEPPPESKEPGTALAWSRG